MSSDEENFDIDNVSGSGSDFDDFAPAKKKPVCSTLHGWVETILTTNGLTGKGGSKTEGDQGCFRKACSETKSCSQEEALERLEWGPDDG